MSSSLATTRKNFICPSQESSLPTPGDFPVNLNRPTDNYFAKVKIKGANLLKQNNEQFRFSNILHKTYHALLIFLLALHRL
jgi:hypothetical protein